MRNAGKKRIGLRAVAAVVVLAALAAIIAGVCRLCAREAKPAQEATVSAFFDFSEYDTGEGELILVNADYPLPQSYSAEGELLEIPQAGARFDTRLDSVKLQPAAYYALDRMLSAAAAEDIGRFAVTGAYVGYEAQNAAFEQRLYEALLAGAGDAEARQTVLSTMAMAGQSERQTGLLVSLGAIEDGAAVAFDGTREQVFATNRCSEFGFVWRYPQAKSSITGVAYEPWAFRYVGLPHSLVMRDKNMVLEEYLDYLEEQGSITAAAEGSFYDIFFVAGSEAGSFENPARQGEEVSVSGDNRGNFIVTVKRNPAAVQEQ